MNILLSLLLRCRHKQIYQNPSVMVISFTDGDGDIGFNEGDTLPPYNYNSVDFNKYYYNLLLYYYEKNDDVWEEVELIVPYYYRIPYLTPTGQNKSLKGEIEVSISLPANRPDSIRFDIELIDRALHSSNILTSPVFTNNLCPDSTFIFLIVIGHAAIVISIFPLPFDSKEAVIDAMKDEIRLCNPPNGTCLLTVFILAEAPPVF